MSRRPKFPPTIYHHKKGYSYCKVQGKEVYLGKTGTAEVQAEYARLVHQLAALRGVPSVSPKNLTVAELLAAYDAACEVRQDWRQLKRIRYALGPVLDLYGPTHAADFGPRALDACRQVFVGRDYARKYVNALVVLIRQAWRWASQRELVPDTVYQALKALPGLDGKSGVHDNPEVPPVPEAVVLRTLPLLFPEIRAMVELQLLTGMRPGEVVLLKPEDIDRQGLVAANGVRVWVYSPGKHKNRWRGKPRQVALGPQAQALLTPFLDRPGDAYCFSPREIVARRWAELNRGRRRPSAREPGLHYTAESYGRNIGRAIDKHNKAEADLARLAGRPPDPIPAWTPRQIRKTVATAIGDINISSCVLGHDKPDTTAIHYQNKLIVAAEWGSEAG